VVDLGNSFFPSDDAESRSSRVKEFLRESLTSLVAGQGAAPYPGGQVPPDLVPHIEAAVSSPDGARDALLLLYAFRLVEGAPIDVSKRIEGDRAVSDYLGKVVLPDLGIAGVKSALEGRSFSHGFLSPEVRNPVVRMIGPWASDPEATPEVVAGIYWALARGIAATAKKFRSLEVLDLHVMTFERVLPLLEHLLAPRSISRSGSGTGGAHEQFLFAAMLQAVYDDEDSRLRVVTKSLNSSDRSARTAGDIQVIGGQARLVESYEVTANRWDSKMDGAAQTLVDFPELDRVHVIADTTGATPEALRIATDQAAVRAGRVVGSVDITVTGVHEECVVLLARASQRGRRSAIRTFHEHLVNRQSDMTLVDALVEKCRELGLFE
jgi:hypothetical protein